MPRYKSQERKPLSEIITERVQSYATELANVYSNQNLAVVSSYEKALDRVNALAREGKIGELEKIAGLKTIGEKDDTRRGGRKPTLTSEAYLEAQKNEWTEKQLKQKYSYTGQKLGAMKRVHGRLKGEQ